MSYDQAEISNNGDNSDGPKNEDNAVAIICTTAFLIFLALLFTVYDGKYGLHYTHSYSSPELSETASNYALKESDKLFSRLSSDVSVRSIEYISVGSGMSGDRGSEITIKYSFGAETRIIKFESNYGQARGSYAWLDMIEPEKIRIYNSEYENNSQNRLTNYAQDTKAIIDRSLSLIKGHINDQEVWKYVFSEKIN